MLISARNEFSGYVDHFQEFGKPVVTWKCREKDQNFGTNFQLLHIFNNKHASELNCNFFVNAFYLRYILGSSQKAQSWKYNIFDLFLK